MTSRVRWLSLSLLLACGGEDPVGSDEVSTSTSDDAEPEPDPALCSPIAVPGGPGLGAQNLELVAVRSAIPGLADQPTAHGRILGALAAFDGRLHLGYGDYSANTGPIAAVAWDPSGSGAFVEFGTLPTEEILWFRPGLGTLYSPAADPDGHQESGGIYRLDCGRDAWHVGTPIPGAVHVYDVAMQGDSIYVGTGSLSGAPALVMASQDYGESWTEVLRRESVADRFSRFTFAGATPEQLFVAGRDYPSPGTAFAWIRRGAGEFEPLVDPPDPSLVPIVLGDAMVIAAFTGNPGRSDYVASYRISGTNSFVPDSPWPTLPGGEAKLVAWGPDGQPDRLLVLMAGADGTTSIQRTDDLASGATAWQELAVLEPLVGDEFVSLALLLGDLYLGTREGSLYALRQLDAPA